MDEKNKKKKDIQKELERWENTTVKKVTDRFPLRKKYYRNLSDYDSKALYTPDDVNDLDYSEDLGFPGEYPFTRHVQPTAYRGRFWTMRMFAGLATSTEMATPAGASSPPPANANRGAMPSNLATILGAAPTRVAVAPNVAIAARI